ncbi:MAG: hypothetical protein WDZ88_02545 [Candidatus Paceibacterota bacterium]
MITKQTNLRNSKTGKPIVLTYDPERKHSFIGVGKPMTIDEHGEDARRSSQALLRALESEDPFHPI